MSRTVYDNNHGLVVVAEPPDEDQALHLQIMFHGDLVAAVIFTDDGKLRSLTWPDGENNASATLPTHALGPTDARGVRWDADLDLSSYLAKCPLCEAALDAHGRCVAAGCANCGESIEEPAYAQVRGPVSPGDNPHDAVLSLLTRARALLVETGHTDGGGILDPLDEAVRHIEELACRGCAGPNDDGEGFDGLCGNCADQAEAARSGDN